MRHAVPFLIAALALAACSPSPASQPTASASPGPSPSPAATSPAATTSPSPAAASPQPTATPAAAAVSFQTDVVPIVRARCAQCHTAGRAAQGYEFFDADGNPQHAVVKARIGEMVAAIKAGRMPLNAPGSLSATEIATLEAYRDAGAPNN